MWFEFFTKHYLCDLNFSQSITTYIKWQVKYYLKKNDCSKFTFFETESTLAIYDNFYCHKLKIQTWLSTCSSFILGIYLFSNQVKNVRIQRKRDFFLHQHAWWRKLYMTEMFKSVTWVFYYFGDIKLST